MLSESEACVGKTSLSIYAQPHKSTSLGISKPVILIVSKNVNEHNIKKSSPVCIRKLQIYNKSWIK